MSLVHGHKSCRACQASAIPATVLHNKHHEHQRHTKWTLTFARSECGGSVCWLSLGWLLCAHSGLWWAVSGSGALIWASGLHMLGVAGLRCSGMVSARLRGEDWLCSIGFIFQQASWDQFSGPHGRPQRRGNLEVTLQAYIMSAHSCLDKVPCLGLSQGRRGVRDNVGSLLLPAMEIVWGKAMDFNVLHPLELKPKLRWCPQCLRTKAFNSKGSISTKPSL